MVRKSGAGGYPRASIGDRDVWTHNREEASRAGIRRLIQRTDSIPIGQVFVIADREDVTAIDGYPDLLVAGRSAVLRKEAQDLYIVLNGQFLHDNHLHRISHFCDRVTILRPSFGLVSMTSCGVRWTIPV